MRSNQLSRAAEAFGHSLFDYIFLPVFALLCAFGGRIALFLGALGAFHATGLALCDGVSPASMGTGDLPQSQVMAYDKTFVESLKAETPWIRCTTRKTLEQNSGNQLKLFMYQNLGPNTVQAAEGTVGTGLKATVLNNFSTLGQYGDFINVSDIAVQTSLDDTLVALQKLLAYRAAQTLNVIVQSTADTAASVDSSVNAHSKAYNVPVATVDITTNVQSLSGRNVLPFGDGTYTGVIHSFIVGDFINDNANNGITDTLKRTAEGAQKLRELPSPDGDMVPVIDWGGVRFHQSTLVKQTPNYQGHGSTALRTYIVGADALFTISLGAKDNTDIGDGDRRNLKVWMKRTMDPSGFDPSRMIGGFTSYNFKMTASLPPDLVMRLRYFDAVPVVS